MTEKFEDVTVLGHPMLFTCLRVDRDTVPQGMYMYEVRHDDDQQGEPVQIANWIMVNHWGTLISNIYTTSVNEATIDEAPMAYKSLKDIIDVIRESVDVIEILKPIYNFKASE